MKVLSNDRSHEKHQYAIRKMAQDVEDKRLYAVV
jgi:hypothetical protein